MASAPVKSLILPLFLVGTILVVLRSEGGRPLIAPVLDRDGGHITKDQGLRNIANHLRKLERSTVALKVSRSLSQGSGFFFAQYYTKSDCSSADGGKVSYVEGYAAGSCLQTSETGSMIQTCSAGGTTMCTYLSNSFLI
jgi:hypothetical protein